jgi:hypothetical protein
MAELAESIRVNLLIAGSRGNVGGTFAGRVNPGIEQLKSAGKHCSPAQTRNGMSSTTYWKTSSYGMFPQTDCVPSKKLMPLGLVLNLGSIGGRIQATL